MSSKVDPRQFGGAGVAPGYDGPCEECGRPGQTVPDPKGRPVSITLCEDCENNYSGGWGAYLQWLLIMLTAAGIIIGLWWKFR